MNNAAYGAFTQPVLCSERAECDSATRMAGSDVANLILGEERARIAGASFVVGAVPSLEEHVQVVVGEGPEEEVIGAHARTVIAMVQNGEPIRDGSEGQLPCHTRSDARPSAGTYLPVAPGVKRSHPFPTPIGLVHFGPKAVTDGHPSSRASLRTAGAVAELVGARTRVCLRDKKRPAVLASQSRGEDGFRSRHTLRVSVSLMSVA